ncbi:MAG: hypothetical protein OEL56_05305 [Nitrosopumilus sp.]|nr:hypothetical protein [Nitrosopumilus sp.]MDH3489847.1 hypothetical protein [Nitrosopumilus sp.]MDH3516670.1 hypothetical protein [Nitrosopumilus sp.]MDH3564678.1 hypothetical protein [Nitrosopumilus sp.]MDH5418327.1 hypothetical protein [Nitrosopumilus sp.]
MNFLRIGSIVLTIIIITTFFASAEIFEAHLEEDTEKPNFDHPFLPYAGLFLFGLPPSIAGIVVSFFKTSKSKILGFSIITVISYVVIFIIAILMLNYPILFDIPETYWELTK